MNFLHADNVCFKVHSTLALIGHSNQTAKCRRKQFHNELLLKFQSRVSFAWIRICKAKFVNALIYIFSICASHLTEMLASGAFELPFIFLHASKYVDAWYKALLIRALSIYWTNLNLTWMHDFILCMNNLVIVHCLASKCRNHLKQNKHFLLRNK